MLVTPCAGVWIEISQLAEFSGLLYVTPCAGVWIEITDMSSPLIRRPLSLPVRECGLKCLMKEKTALSRLVTPCAGVWIEINRSMYLTNSTAVTPCAGVWIEILEREFGTAEVFGHSLCGSVD